MSDPSDYELFVKHMQLHYKYSPGELEITDTPGVWRVKGGCPGGIRCRHAFRGVLGSCSGGGTLTVSFTQYGARDERGRFASPFREWKRQRGGKS